MPNVMFRVESIRAERYSFEAVESLGINMQIMLGKPDKVNENTYSYGFLVKVDCAPPIASIDIKGTMFVTPQTGEDMKLIEESMKSSPPPQLIVAVYSYVLPLAALLARELGLPPPCPPPQPPTHATPSGSPTQYHV